MAHVITLHQAFGAVAGADIPEGRMVQLSASGLKWELPTAVVAPANATGGVFMIFVTPVEPRIPRPIPEGLLMRNDRSFVDPRTGLDYRFKTHDYENAWLLQPSILPAPTALSGWVVALHRGGTYLLQSTEFILSDGIKNAGAAVKIATSGMLAYDSAGTYAVGYVREWNATEGTLIVSLK